MGAVDSSPVSVVVPGETEGPYAPRIDPLRASIGPYKNPPGFRTMQDLVVRAFRFYPDRVYLGQRPLVDGKFLPEYKWITYADAAEIAYDFGSGLTKLDINSGSFLGVYSHGGPAWVHTINASSLYGFVIASLYDTLGPDSLAYLVGHSQMTTVLVSTRNLERLCNVLTENKYKVQNIITIDDSAADTARAKVTPLGIKVYSMSEVQAFGRENRIPLPKIDPESPHFICYSSGTTGSPKGVIISHRSFVSNLIVGRSGFGTAELISHLSFLPFAHVFERIMCGGITVIGGKMGFLSSLATIMEDVALLKPSCFAAVPRIFIRIYDGLNAKLKASPPVARFIFNFCYAAKRYCQLHDLPVHIWDKIVFGKIQAAIGGNATELIMAGAAVEPAIHDFFQVVMGAPVRNGYGCSESGTGNICSPDSVKLSKPGVVGGPLINAMCKLEPVPEFDDPECGQVCIGGECVCSGYLHDEETTKGLFVDEERRWVRTGDVGRWEPGGYLRIVDRVRSIFKLSQGEYVSAEMVTQAYEETVPYIQQLYVYGDSGRSCLIGFIVPKRAEVAKFLGKETITNEEFAAACNDPKLKEAVLEQMNAAAKAKGLFGFQWVKAIHLDPREWSADNSLLTPTLKVRRKALGDFYAKEIEAIYREYDESHRQ
jgi:long-chain acyl-CoA synthetase